MAVLCLYDFAGMARKREKGFAFMLVTGFSCRDEQFSESLCLPICLVGCRTAGFDDRIADNGVGVCHTDYVLLCSHFLCEFQYLIWKSNRSFGANFHY